MSTRETRSRTLALLACLYFFSPLEIVAADAPDAVLAAKPLIHVGEVISITDGDTIKILVNKKTLIVRLEGIDAPEKGQPFGTVSKKLLAKLAFKRECRVTEKGRDKYQRILGEVEIEGESVNLKMVEAGMAWHYAKYNKEARFITAEKKARVKKLGLWSDKKPAAPWSWRKMSKQERTLAITGRAKEATIETAAPELTHWLNTKGGVRHNSTCRWYKKTKHGHKCSANAGRACGQCGG